MRDHVYGSVLLHLYVSFMEYIALLLLLLKDYAWWYTPVILAPRKSEAGYFLQHKVSLGSIVRLCFTANRKKTKT